MHRVGAWRRTIGANALSRLPSFLEKISSQAATRKARLAAALPEVLGDLGPVDEVPDLGRLGLHSPIVFIIELGDNGFDFGRQIVLIDQVKQAFA